MSFQQIETIAYQGADIAALMDMLTTKRPHGSKAEKQFIAKYIACVPGMESDGFGNLILRIPGVGDDILWSSHTDTVHSTGGRQAIVKSRDIVTLSSCGKSNCLGADDAAGIWLMLEMIKAKKPGLYIFHRGEEIGGLGSDYIATHTPKLLDGIKAAIALDRKGYDSVITHQFGRCASDIFAWSLAEALGIDGFKPDDTGLFTDTAHYTDLIGECTNLSVGYFAQHSKHESLDVGFLVALRSALLSINTESLVISRKAGDIEAIAELEPLAVTFESDYDYNWHNGTTNLSDNYSEYYQQEKEKMLEIFHNDPGRFIDTIQDLGITIDDILDATR